MSASPVRKLAKCSLLKPILVVLGATSVGKSKLALELARKFSGEIVNADAMQVYKGLDIVTNKVSKEEQSQCPHHLLDYISPLKSAYNVSDYQTSALKILDDIHNRGKLPVIVGGTNYYIEALLWDFVLQYKKREGTSEVSESDISEKELYDRLMKVDPERAKQIHPSDVRKVKRALEVLEHTGRTHSSLLREQHGKEENGVSGAMRYSNSCMLWVKCDQTVLDDRIERRVDAMLEMGLLNELLQFHKDYNYSLISRSQERRYEHGIFQTIGFKEFHEYLVMSEEERQTDEGKRLFEEGVANMKLATRQYSKRQVKWIKNRFLKKRGNAALPPVYAFDSSELEKWDDNVKFPAFEIVESFLKGAEIKQDPLPVGEYDNPSVYNYCPDCDKTFVKLDSWTHHMRGKPHKNRVLKNKRLKAQNDIPSQLLEAQS